ncbi:unnamed protein product [Calicophoron daubneyi]|uniref:Galactosyltransferase N-terminal domain-containing protein n=1 Tax=Calicophoron daubneyi TaxID=300641 RepID=A0AAV2T7A5_CALDB
MLVGRIRISRTPPTWEQLEARYVGTDTVTPPAIRNTTNITTHGNGTWTSVTIIPLPTDTVHGLWMPVECRPSQMLALILPYRKRDEHLRAFLNHMHGFLRHQQVMYTILVIEQIDSGKQTANSESMPSKLEFSSLAAAYTIHKAVGVLIPEGYDLR